jgi:hypothetical protein
MSERPIDGELTAEEVAKLALLQAEFERDGKIAIERLRESDPVLYVRVVASFARRWTIIS